MSDAAADQSLYTFGYVDQEVLKHPNVTGALLYSSRRSKGGLREGPSAVETTGNLDADKGVYGIW